MQRPFLVSTACTDAAIEVNRKNISSDPTLPLTFPQPTVTEDFAHLPPEQRRKRLQQKLDELGKELQKEVDQRCVCTPLPPCATASLRGGSTVVIFMRRR